MVPEVAIISSKKKKRHGGDFFLHSARLQWSHLGKCFLKASISSPRWRDAWPSGNFTSVNTSHDTPASSQRAAFPRQPRAEGPSSANDNDAVNNLSVGPSSSRFSQTAILLKTGLSARKSHQLHEPARHNVVRNNSEPITMMQHRRHC